MTVQMTDDVGRDQRRSDGVRALHRSSSNRILAGVCGGVAEHYRADARAVRLLALLLALFTGIFPMLFVYLIAAIMLPADETLAAAGAQVGPGQLGIVVGGLLVAVGAAGIATVWLHVSWDSVWPVVLILLGTVLLVVALRGHQETA
jgi:phage shock protein PspC (stress-responsive transcriptional regulator)